MRHGRLVVPQKLPHSEAARDASHDLKTCHHRTEGVTVGAFYGDESVRIGKDFGGGGGSRTHVRKTRIRGFYVRILPFANLTGRAVEEGASRGGQPCFISGHGTRQSMPLDSL